MSKTLFDAIDQGNRPALQAFLEKDPDAVRATRNLAEQPSKALGRRVVSPLEWAILRRDAESVSILLQAAPFGEQGRDPDAAVKVLLEVLGDDWAEIHLPDRDRHPTVRDALAPPPGMTASEALRATGQVVAALDQKGKGGIDWTRQQDGRPRVDHLDLHADSPAAVFLRPIVDRVRAQMVPPLRPRRAAPAR
jgi:hypothetical protein